MSFEVKLPLFEGPFDLLLFFIERDELDIYDIPISRITNDFLDYIQQLEVMEIEVASEFILVAATLMRIKAKMLLPRPELDESGNKIDPREELVRHLLEYKKYKSVVEDLNRMEESRMQHEARGNVQQEVAHLASTTNVEAELQHLDLYKLLKTYLKVLKRYEAEQNKPIHRVVQFPYTIEQKKAYILQLVENNREVSFGDILMEEPNRIALVFNFLAILELIQLNELLIRVGLGFNNFWIRRRSSDYSPVIEE